MASQRPSTTLAPQLRAVLSSLNINLEAELNRYRRDSFTDQFAGADLFADIEEEAAFDLASVSLEEVSSSVTRPVAALPVSPPPVPKNKKLFPETSTSPVSERAAVTDGARQHPKALHGMGQVDELSNKPHNQAESYQSDNSAVALSNASQVARSEETAGQALATSATGYLSSSEKLIESLNEVPPMPEPVSTALKPQRKTVSLLVGAALGLFALVAGLGASYLMSNPSVAQRLANGFNRDDDAIASASKSTFDPPGPDLSAKEFIDLEIDNLSSLEMPQTALDPAVVGSTEGLPPIANVTGDVGAQTAQPAQTVPGSTPANQIPGQTAVNQPLAPSNGPSAIASQAALIPPGSNYYVTVPFATEQGLIEIRQTVNEAFVRKYTDGANRIQLAAFDNPQSAQQFIEEIQVQGISAQVYGPTGE